jgi:hypothetical protein
MGMRVRRIQFKEKGCICSPFPLYVLVDPIGMRRHNETAVHRDRSMTTSPLLQRFVEDELTRSAGLAERTCTGTLEQLRQPRDGMLNTTERQQYFELVEALHRQSASFQREFCDALRGLVMADLSGTQADGDASADSTGGLQLMDETRVESDIEISRATQLIDAAAEWEIRELQMFTSTLVGQKHITAESNPLRPLAYARALWQASCLVTPVPVQRALLLRTAAGVMSKQLKLAWAAACTRLEAQGVEPSIYRTVVLAPGAGLRPPTFDVTKPGALEDLLSNMPGSPPGQATGQVAAPGQPSIDASAAQGTIRQPLSQGANPAFEQALLRLEALLRNLPAMPGLTEPASAALGEHRAALMATTNATVDRQIVELLSRLFEAVLSDAQLPPAFRSVMARLQVSALRVALADTGMVQKHDHPLWQLMNRIALASETYVQPDDPRSAALLAFCETLIDEMGHAVAPNAALYKLSLGKLDAFLTQQLREQQLRARESIDALTLAEQRQVLERDLSQRLADQSASVRTSASIRHFVTGTWAKVLADAMLRFGDQVEPTVGYLKAVDDLLWSLRLPDHPQSRQRLIGLLPGLLQRLRAGMASIAMPTTDQQRVLDELMAVHTEALKPSKNAPAPALTPQQIVESMRQEALADDDNPSRPPFSDSLIDLGSMETVPAELMPEEGPTQTDPTRQVEAMPPGGRHRVFLHGRWTRTQLLWRSPQAQFFLFAGESAAKTHSVTRRALERLTEEGLVKPLETASLMQRAVDSLMSKLSLPQ